MVVDGVPYRILSPGPLPDIATAKQLSVDFTPTKTTFVLEAGPFIVNATFMSPVTVNIPTPIEVTTDLFSKPNAQEPASKSWPSRRKCTDSTIFNEMAILTMAATFICDPVRAIKCPCRLL